MPVLPPDLIEDLASDDDLARTVAAEQIHHFGSAPALRVMNRWQQNPDLARLFTDPLLDVIVGLAVQPETFAEIRAAVGTPELSDVPPDQDALEFELHLASGITLDILTTKDPAGPGAIARYLAKFGEGIQQVEFPCKNVDAATEILKTKFAISPVYPGKRLGANNTLINFFLVHSPVSSRDEKLLIELFEESPATPPVH
jgi:hypothetical protein